MNDAEKAILQGLLDKADEIRKAVQEYEAGLETVKGGLAALTTLVQILHDRVSRIEEHMTASEEKVLSGDLPFIGITPDQAIGLLLLNMELNEKAKEAKDG